MSVGWTQSSCIYNPVNTTQKFHRLRKTDYSFVGAFAYFQKGAHLLHHVHLSVCPHASVQLPPKLFPWNLRLGTFSQICRETPNLFKIGQFTKNLKNYFIFLAATYVSQQYKNTLLFIHANDLNIYYSLTEIYDRKRLRAQFCVYVIEVTREIHNITIRSYVHCLPRSVIIPLLTSYPAIFFNKFRHIDLLVTKSDVVYLL